ncbi:uncharacterized protein LOC134255994 [Saccostrea cucullata]|uniref:uncharacterized protein LOC134255994 n=1 Tax=Saccostrea cuccullata TaxID=36930 RepID=UPI002ED13499
MEIEKAFSESVDNIMNFAEILYKCTLCTTLPSILTSKNSFVSHVKGHHFKQNLTRCLVCSLSFETEEDLHAHSRSSHCGEDAFKGEGDHQDSHPKEEEITSAEETLIPITQENEVEQDKKCVNVINTKCDTYNCVGHRVNSEITNITAQSIERPFMMNVDGQNISDGMEAPWPEMRPKVNIEYGLENSVRQHPCTNNLSKIHAVADQILAVNSTKPKPTGNSMIFSPGFTPEFGKFTKLVREGGNIVYFCQVCNWKSQIKSHFQSHCQGKVHKEKLKCAEEQHDEKSPSPAPRREHNSKEKQCDSVSPVNLSIENGMGSSTAHSPVISERNKLERQNKRKRSVPISLRNQASDRDGWQSSDSDSDSADISRSRLYHSGRTPVKKRHSKDNKPSPNAEVRPKIDNSCRPALLVNSDSDSNHIQGYHNPGNPSMSLTSKGYRDEDPTKFPFGLYNQIHNQILWNLSNKSVDKGKKTVDSPLPYLDRLSYPNSKSFSSSSPHVSPPRGSPFCPEISKSDSEFMYRCSLCSFGCNKIQEYRTHFEFQHEQGNSLNEQGPLCGTEGKELWKVNKIKECLTDLICLFPKGNVSRDLLLQKISSITQLPEAVHWGPACNRAVREIFPDTLAQRKGKFKKTYFFGVSFIEQVQEPADDLSDPELMQYQPLRDMSQDLEKILEHLHNLVQFSEDAESSVSRDDLLTVLHKRIDEPDVLYWGMQCNRAIRIVFPSVVIKRKGKFKTTVYQGVDFKEEVKMELQQLPFSLPNKKGRPRKISSEDSGEMYQMGMSWTDAIRTGHSETYKMYTNIHVPRPFPSENLSVTRGWGPGSLAYHDTGDPQKQGPSQLSQNKESVKRTEHFKLDYEVKGSGEDSVLNISSLNDYYWMNGPQTKSFLNGSVQKSCPSEQAFQSEKEAESDFNDVSENKQILSQKEDDQSEDNEDENTDEDADDEESIGPNIEDKDID